MSNFVSTNIRIPKKDYLKLKEEALKKWKSLAAVIRDKIAAKEKAQSKPDVDIFLAKLSKLAKKNAKYFEDTDGTKIIRQMRDNAK